MSPAVVIIKGCRVKVTQKIDIEKKKENLLNLFVVCNYLPSFCVLWSVLSF